MSTSYKEPVLSSQGSINNGSSSRPPCCWNLLRRLMSSVIGVVGRVHRSLDFDLQVHIRLVTNEYQSFKDI
ncbi:hypothetical protein Y1Q_0021584 [Alligator mississippiensis]|uniref:Uncharacterized protein n=1 Tax=Alligator mississippiensis TaxID=8496 RepID=A0A151PB63_ALLMI|nr:hypothetical protein Y1Q_0021584 [Alligator mississippiensis]